MKSLLLLSALLLCFLIPLNQLSAQGPSGKTIGIGFTAGDPIALNAKYWVSQYNSLDAYIGTSYFGAVRLGSDFLMQFDPFDSKTLKMYTGMGVTLAFGRGEGILYKQNQDRFYYRSDGGIATAMRILFGIGLFPQKTPFEVFLEAGPLFGISPDFGIHLDVGIGIRFYPFREQILKNQSENEQTN